MNLICPTPMPLPGNGEGSATPAHVPNPEVQNDSSTKKSCCLFSKHYSSRQRNGDTQRLHRNNREE